MVQLLLAFGADVQRTNCAGLSPVQLAIESLQRGPPDAARLLVQQLRAVGGKLDALDDLIFAGKAAEIGALLTLEPRLVHLTNRFGNAPLREAARLRRTNLVAVLLERGASWDVISAAMLDRGHALERLLSEDPRQVTNELYGTPSLHLAARAGNARNVRLVLEAGADLQRQDRKGLTAWGAARSATNAAVAELLVEQGARPTLFDAIELHDATLTLDLLRQTPAAATITNQTGIPAAHLAVARGLDSVLAQMLEDGLTPDFATAQGLTPLHLAAREGGVEVARLLLAAGASPQRMTMRPAGQPSFSALNDFNPLHEAASAGQADMVELLVTAGAEVNARTSDGRTAWDLARLAGAGRGRVGAGRSHLSGPYELLETDPFSRRIGRHWLEAQRETLAVVESLGGMPGPGRPGRPIPAEH